MKKFYSVWYSFILLIDAFGGVDAQATLYHLQELILCFFALKCAEIGHRMLSEVMEFSFRLLGFFRLVLTTSHAILTHHVLAGRGEESVELLHAWDQVLVELIGREVPARVVISQLPHRLLSVHDPIFCMFLLLTRQFYLRQLVVPLALSEIKTSVLALTPRCLRIEAQLSGLLILMLFSIVMLDRLGHVFVINDA